MASFGPDLAFATVTHLNRLVSSRQVRAQDLTRGFLDRLRRFGPTLNAVASLTEELALQKARQVDDDVQRERLRGHIQGVPCAVQDTISLAGRPSGWGSLHYASQRAEEDATIVVKLGRAGSPLLAKLAMIELGGAGGFRFPYASSTGPCLNPWDLTRWAGGACGGSAAAVAAGTIPFAVGLDTGGSFSIASACCGVTAFIPTYGYVSRAGVMPVAWSLDRIGIVCRCVEDCGYVLSAISGGDPADPASSGRRFHYLPRSTPSLNTFRVGFLASEFDRVLSPDLKPPFQEALKEIRGLGVQLAEAKLPALAFEEIFTVIFAAESSAVFEPLLTKPGEAKFADPVQADGLRSGTQIPAVDYLRAQRLRHQLQAELRRLFAQMDFLLAPAVLSVAPPAAQALASPYWWFSPPLGAAARLLAASGLAGLPALVLPCGFAGNLPIALLLVGRPFSENSLLRLGVEFQTRTDWHLRRPPSFDLP